jgi:hypothetical protein
MIHKTATARGAALTGLVMALVLAARAVAADPPAPATTTPAGPAAPAPTAPAPPAKDTAAGPTTKPAEASKGTPQHFEPTEKTRADFEVSFPVDI